MSSWPISDGVVVIRRSDLSEVIERAEEKFAQEAVKRLSIQQGVETSLV